MNVILIYEPSYYVFRLKQHPWRYITPFYINTVTFVIIIGKISPKSHVNDETLKTEKRENQNDTSSFNLTQNTSIFNFMTWLRWKKNKSMKWEMQHAPWVPGDLETWRWSCITFSCVFYCSPACTLNGRLLYCKYILQVINLFCSLLLSPPPIG